MIPSLFLEPGFLEGWVRHKRLQPRPHQYSLKNIWVCIDVDQFNMFGEGLPYWKLNTFGLHSLDRSHFFGSPSESIRSTVERHLETHNLTTPIGQILAITACKNMGLGRNPAEFYLAHDEEANLIAIIVNLKNQHSESYPYVFIIEDQNNLTFQSEKALYISGHTPMNVVYYWQFYIGKRHFMMNLRVERPIDPKAPRINSLLFPERARQDAIKRILMEVTMSSTLRPFSAKTAKKLGKKYALNSIQTMISRFWTKLILNENGFPQQHPSKTGEPHPREIPKPVAIRTSKRRK